MAERIMPEVNLALCTGCGDCVSACPQGAVRLEQGKPRLDEERCAYCGDCEDICPEGAVALPYEIVVSPPEEEQGA